MLSLFRPLLAVPMLAASLAAQTDYYNTDSGRPVYIEDAFPLERYGFEVQLAPLRIDRGPGDTYRWSLEPAIAYGLLPRTHIEVGFPVAFLDLGPDEHRSGLAGIELSLLHNINLETLSLPAFAIVLDALLPAGGLAPDRGYASVKGIATRSFRIVRVHVNGSYGFWDDDTPAGPSAEVARWTAGVAVDKTLPLRALLMTAEVTPVVAPEFTRRYPDAAIIFDNLHAMHDVISDILASSQVARGRKRAEILRVAAWYRDDTSFVVTREAWREMASTMGVQNMGGVATGLMRSLPQPTVPLGATHDDAVHRGHRVPADTSRSAKPDSVRSDSTRKPSRSPSP